MIETITIGKMELRPISPKWFNPPTQNPIFEIPI